jgi:hypothetical protein
MSGEGLFVVIVVGPDSCAGKIRSKLTDDEAERPSPDIILVPESRTGDGIFLV